jgi:oligopeptidase B
VLLRTEMVAGHGGKSGRYDSWKQVAWEWAFVADQVGATQRIDDAPVQIRP